MWMRLDLAFGEWKFLACGPQVAVAGRPIGTRSFPNALDVSSVMWREGCGGARPEGATDPVYHGGYHLQQRVVLRDGCTAGMRYGAQ